MLDNLRYLLIGLLLIVVQFFLIQEVNFGTWIKPMPYIFLVFILPFEMNRFLKLFIAFFIGFVLDSIGDTYGLHATATTLLGFIRVYSDKIFLNADAIQLQGFNYLTPDFKGLGYYSRYTGILIFLHHFTFFSLNYFKFSAFPVVFIVSLLSSLFTFGFFMLYRAIARSK